MKNNWTRIICACGLLGLAGFAAPKGIITGFTVVPVGEGEIIHVIGSGLAKPHIMSINGGRGIALNFEASFKGSELRYAIRHAGLWSARLTPFSHGKGVQVYIAKHPTCTPIIVPTQNGYDVYTNMDAATYDNIVKGPSALNKPKILVPTLPKVSVLPPKFIDSNETKNKVVKTTSKADARALGPVVSLDFVNTDVVQILKALALQSGVNIMTAPDVQGSKVSVSLQHIHVKDALDYVTALAGLRYAQVQNSYVVTGKEDYNSIMADLADRTTKENQIKVVPLISGDGGDIKNALARWFGPSTLQVVLPGDKGADAIAAQAGAPAASAGPTGDANAPYLMLIGKQNWVDQAETLVKKLDNDIVEARGEGQNRKQSLEEIKKSEQAALDDELQKARNVSQDTQTYTVENGKASALVKELVGIKDFQTLSFVASPDNSLHQVLVIKGNKDLALEAMKTLEQLDGTSVASSEMQVYDVKYADPRALREDVSIAVPGLTVLIPPGSVGNPEMYAPGAETSQLNQSQALGQAAVNGNTTQSGTQSTSSNSSNSSTSSGGGSSASGGSSGMSSAASGLVSGGYSTLNALQSMSVPMKLILRGTQTQITQAMQYLSLVDTPPHQVAIELRVMELTKQEAENAGINWSIATGGTVKTINLNQSAPGVGTNGSPANSLGAHIGGRNWGADVTATLDALATKNNLISRPNMLALDGRVSAVFVGDDIKYIESIQSSQNGVSVQTGDVPVGVTLDVLPHVGGDGNITMELFPVVSFLKSFTTVPGGGQLPQTSQRASLSTVQMKSGETIAIGGLIQDQDLNTVQKLPFLGDLPVLGNLFRSTQKSKIRTEVVFFLTVRDVTKEDRDSAADPNRSKN